MADWETRLRKGRKYRKEILKDQFLLITVPDPMAEWVKLAILKFINSSKPP